MKRLSVQKQEFIKKIAKGVESPVKFEELLPAQQKTFEKGLADYRENLAGMDPEGAASLTAQSINIWRNMKAGVARYRDGVLDIDRILLSDDLAVTLSIFHERQPTNSLACRTKRNLKKTNS